MPTRRKVNSVRVVLLVVVCILIIAGLAGVFVVKKDLSSTGNGDKNIVFTIESGDTLDQVVENLENENLISNANKYNKSNGRIDIELKKNQKNMYFSVEDTGIGIAKKDQERIFQRFYRVDKQRSKTIPGTGLGLSIVKHVVYYYEGKVHLTSKENIGTKIVVELPIIVKEIPEN